MKKIGIKNFDMLYFLNSSSLKSDFLFFDEIRYDPLQLESILPFTELISKTVCDRTGKMFEGKMKEIEFLSKNNLLKEFERIEISNCSDMNKIANSEQLKILQIKVTELITERNELLNADFADNIQNRLERVFTCSTEISDLHSLFLSFITNYEGVFETTPIVFYPQNLSFNENLISNKSKVINLTLDRFPSLKYQTEWNQIIEIKSDEELKHKYLKLNNWINEISLESYSINEIQEKLEFMLADYEKQLKYHSKQIEYSKLELLLNSSIGIIENLLKLNLTEIGKNTINAKKEKLNLEINKQFLSGNEIAYITEVGTKKSLKKTTYNNIYK
ncbi:hypothetical protein G1K75_12420 [Tenacibaculum finnmarkense]|uniref:hypothetical protein n=1 Tax=Tenacibaculum finnmarkense TaxID=2781243 RepID=UPI001EFA8645|nr:hypothetical protein [Tenacibaculum finnmarkense]MCG8806456.1 hypothetical protein [Tenacibaculum finnmarkense]MCG8857576.1 hypothetical protein [Tenacibaculum finnmarkense]